jgi:hypothetical protein
VHEADEIAPGVAVQGGEQEAGCRQASTLSA